MIKTSILATGITTVVFGIAMTLPVAAQKEALRALYDSAATISTNVEGVRAYPAPPMGFDPVAASDEELAAYGISVRPDKALDPDGYRRWLKMAMVMSNPRNRWYGLLEPRPVSTSPQALMRTAGSSTTFGPTSVQGPSWSGVVDTLPGTTFSSTASFASVQGEFAVPVPQEAFAPGGGNICDGGTDRASFWVGLGGLTVTGTNLGKQNNLAQSGVDIHVECGATNGHGAYAWVEWYPGVNVRLFDVNPGDDIQVSVQCNSATGGSFSITDFTQQKSAGYAISAPNGFQLVGNEADFIVERPSGDAKTPKGYYPLANYIWSFWDFSRATTFNGTHYYPGGTTASTYDISMTDDSAVNVISVPSIDKGLQNLFVSDEGCAYTGGCTP